MNIVAEVFQFLVLTGTIFALFVVIVSPFFWLALWLDRKTAAKCAAAAKSYLDNKVTVVEKGQRLKQLPFQKLLWWGRPRNCRLDPLLFLEQNGDRAWFFRYHRYRDFTWAAVIDVKSQVASQLTFQHIDGQSPFPLKFSRQRKFERFSTVWRVYAASDRVSETFLSEENIGRIVGQLNKTGSVRCLKFEDEFVIVVGPLYTNDLPKIKQFCRDFDGIWRFLVREGAGSKNWIGENKEKDLE